ncbi:BadM/Rrf2 family transcriptional regulator [Moraxella macacae 0408225]|uniref:BadM/Rrf2 family transcriptional regulator n=1 Tax=Moraxella macacae 0408225 TaxID=1230338 RepID=L2F732_9GAMM|nr:BadM/Rrf2 family transcriptional regulator [Moraxella macacae 0408225]
MRLTTRGRYAVTALLDLALQDSQHDVAVSLSDIAKRQEISISYLEQLFSKLRKKGLVVSTRGALGGYRIAKPLNEISIMHIISAVDESVDARACEGEGNCQDGAMCLTHDLWSGLSYHIEQYLSNVTLAELIHKKNIRNIAERQRKMLEENHEQVVQLKFDELSQKAQNQNNQNNKSNQKKQPKTIHEKTSTEKPSTEKTINTEVVKQKASHHDTMQHSTTQHNTMQHGTMPLPKKSLSKNYQTNKKPLENMPA